MLDDSLLKGENNDDMLSVLQAVSNKAYNGGNQFSHLVLYGTMRLAGGSD